VYELVVIGASWGGLRAVGELLAGLPEKLELAFAVAQHRGPDARRGGLEELLQVHTAYPVREVSDKEPIEPGHVYLAPPDYHLLVDGDEFSLTVDEPVRFSRPSIDVFFESVADRFGPEAVGVVLTGANDDGAQGLRQIATRGGLAIVQDPRTAESPIMPRAALRAVPSARIMSLERVTPFLVSLVTDDQKSQQRQDRRGGTDEVRA
jgi:two-component system, chemotaxis family, protein-glutamate methylesterase/glutaminase